MRKTENLQIVVRAGLGKSVKGLGEKGNAIEKRGEAAKRSGKKMAALGRSTMLLAMPVFAFFGGTIAKFNAQEKAVAEVTSSLESMGVTWTDAGQIQARAKELALFSTFPDQDILHMQSVLLTFGNITGDQFAATEQMAIDMSAALGQDLASSAIMLGKAFNDPIEGLSALSRVGVSFSEDQKAAIKKMADAGDLMGAQGIMMEVMERQFGGTAKAIAGTDGGKLKIAMNDFGDMMEIIGAVLAPILVDILQVIVPLVSAFDRLPGPIQKIAVYALMFVMILGPLMMVIGQLTILFGFLAGTAGGSALIAWGAVLMPLIVANLALVIGALVLAIVIGWLIWKNWDTIMGILKAVVGITMDTVKAVVTVSLRAMRTAADALQKIGNVVATVMKAIQTVITFIFGAIKLYFTVWFKVLQTLFFVAVWTVATVVEAGLDAVQTVWEGVWNRIGGTVKETWGKIKSTVSGGLDYVKSFLGNTLATMLETWNRTLGKVLTEVAKVFAAIQTKIKEIWGNVLTWITTTMESFTGIFTEAFTNIAGAIKGVFTGLAEAIRGAFEVAMDWVIDQINAAIDLLNRVPFVDIPKINLGFGGMDLGGPAGNMTPSPNLALVPMPADPEPSAREITIDGYENDPAGVAAEIAWRLATA